MNDDVWHSSQVPSLAHGIVTQDELNRWVEEQFTLEASGELVINSIEKREDAKDTQHYVSVFISYICGFHDSGHARM